MRASVLKIATATGRVLRKRGAWFALAALLVALAVGIVWARSGAALNDGERKLVGTWVRDQSPGVKRLLTLESKRRVHAFDVNQANVVVGEVLGDKDEKWYADNQDLFIRRGRKGRPTLRELLGDSSNRWDQWHITFQSDDTLILESQGSRWVLKRAPDEASRTR